MNTRNKDIPCLITIFGATGDLSHRKLFPSLFHLYQQENLNEHIAIIGIGRRDLTNDDFRNQVKSSIQEHVKDTKHLDKFITHIFYHKLDVTNKANYESLLEVSERLDQQFQLQGNRLFYLAMAPKFFGVISDCLKSAELTNTKGFKRLVIEKPFGSDLESAKVLNDQLRKSFSEEEIYRIDHYLGKDMVQNIEVLRFANAMFEPLWNNKYISNIQVTSSEKLGVEERGGYYDSNGALKDMVQNHMLQMVALLAMEPPISLNSEDIRAEKVKALKSLRMFENDKVRHNFVRGQYDASEIEGQPVQGYRDEDRVDNQSNTPTFVAGKLTIDNFRWAGVPFYIRTGKRMTSKTIQVVVEFKEVPMNLYYETDKKLDSNLLVINIQPNEGVSLHLNAKRNIQGIDTEPVQLSYAMSAQDKMNTVDAYENLLFDCLNGDATNFTHWEELKSTWKFVDAIQEEWDQHEPEFPNYKAGTNGPLESDLLLSKDGYHWWDGIN
ncbi:MULTISPECIES: glucose-6-phosphate dehydrogenase [Staphylococcus]|uniref:Glucose-6-phosphate 1-dehydrogenase n=1 Tax=Staphylococcus hsinchuensis TaxID=3051183 RepID=A0ABZ3ECL1_9STAP|nr:glucose-6-phosphate dehydrogenase [Staphylococcus sp. Marseille-Q5304]